MRDRAVKETPKQFQRLNKVGRYETHETFQNDGRRRTQDTAEIRLLERCSPYESFQSSHYKERCTSTSTVKLPNLTFSSLLPKSPHPAQSQHARRRSSSRPHSPFPPGSSPGCALRCTSILSIRPRQCPSSWRSFGAARSPGYLDRWCR